MSLSPEQARAKRVTAADYADWLVIQIDAWLTCGWNEPSITCFHIPTYLKHNPLYAEIVAHVLQRYRPMWPHIHSFSTPAYSCDFVAFVTKPCEVSHTATL
jgi:hypothetical protein